MEAGRLNSGKACLPGPHPAPLPTRVQGDPGRNPAGPTGHGGTARASPSMAPLCTSQDGRMEPSPAPLPAGALGGAGLRG